MYVVKKHRTFELLLDVVFVDGIIFFLISAATAGTFHFTNKHLKSVSLRAFGFVFCGFYSRRNMFIEIGSFMKHKRLLSFVPQSLSRFLIIEYRRSVLLQTFSN